MRLLAAVVTLALALPTAAAAQYERLSDKELKSLMDTIDDHRHAFEGALDSDLKHSVMRNATSEVDVSKYLDDFQKNINTMKDRFKPGYSASTEAQVVLHQASDIDAFMKQQGNAMKGASEWNTLAADFTRLAASYGAPFPLPQGAPVRRVGDKELTAAADTLTKQADGLKKAIDHGTKGLSDADKAEAKNVEKEADALKQDAKNFKDRIDDGKPASAEAKGLVDRINRIDSFVSGHSMGAAASSLAGIKSTMSAIAQSFGL